MGLLGDIGGAVGNIAVLAGAAGKNREAQRYKELIRLIQELELSDFDMRELDAPELLSYGQIAPESYEVPEFDVALPESSAQTREEQLMALGDLGEFADEGATLEAKLQAMNAQRALASEHGRNLEGTLSALAARGDSGGGAGLAARIGAGQQSANLARDMGQDLTQQILNRQYQAILARGDLAGTIRGQDFGESADKAEMANRFNAFIAGQTADARRYAADARTGAAERNLARREEIGDTNARAQYEAEARNQEYLNRLLEATFGQQLDKTKLLAGAYGGLAGADYRRYLDRAGRITGAGQSSGDAVGGIASLGLGLV